MQTQDADALYVTKMSSMIESQDEMTRHKKLNRQNRVRRLGAN